MTGPYSYHVHIPDMPPVDDKRNLGESGTRFEEVRNVCLALDHMRMQLYALISASTDLAVEGFGWDNRAPIRNAVAGSKGRKEVAIS